MLNLIINEKVVNLRAWQLYLGNGIFTFAVGLILIIISKVLGLFGLNNATLNRLLSSVGKISNAQDPHQLIEHHQHH